MSYRVIPENIKQNILSLYELGKNETDPKKRYSISRLARDFKVARQTVRRVIKSEE